MLATQYTSAVDVWSVGCILAELILRRPLFPGKHNYDQIDKIFDIIGTPTPKEIEKIQDEKFRKYVGGLPYKPKTDFSELFSNANPLAIDLMEKMLVFDPENRISVQLALQHPYLVLLHDPEDEPSCPKIFADDFEYDGFDTDKFRDMILREVENFRASVSVNARGE